MREVAATRRPRACPSHAAPAGARRAPVQQPALQVRRTAAPGAPAGACPPAAGPGAARTGRLSTWPWSVTKTTSYGCSTTRDMAYSSARYASTRCSSPSACSERGPAPVRHLVIVAEHQVDGGHAAHHVHQRLGVREAPAQPLQHDPADEEARSWRQSPSARAQRHTSRTARTMSAPSERRYATGLSVRATSSPSISEDSERAISLRLASVLMHSRLSRSGLEQGEVRVPAVRQQARLAALPQPLLDVPARPGACSSAPCAPARDRTTSRPADSGARCRTAAPPGSRAWRQASPRTHRPGGTSPSAPAARRTACAGVRMASSSTALGTPSRWTTSSRRPPLRTKPVELSGECGGKAYGPTAATLR